MLGSDSYPVFLEDLSKSNRLCADEAPEVLYIVAALEDITFEPDEPALSFARNAFGVAVNASRNEPLYLAGQVFCETKSVRLVAQWRQRDIQAAVGRASVTRGCVRSRRVISSALAETKRPALSCWAHSSL